MNIESMTVSVFQPTLFQIKKHGEALNNEQLLCFKVVEVVRELAAFMSDEPEFFDKLQLYQANQSTKGFLEDLHDKANVIYLDDAKVGEDVGVPAVIPDQPNTIQELLAEPLTFSKQ